MTSIDPRLLDPICDANDAENFNRLLALIDAGWGSIKTESSTEFKAYLDSLEWETGGTYTEVYDGTTYTVPATSGAYAMKKCPWSKFPAAPNADSYHIVVGDDTTKIVFNYDLVFGTLTPTVPNARQYTIGEDSICWFSFTRALGIYAIGISKSTPISIVAWQVTPQGELKRTIRFDSAGLTFEQGCTTSSSDGGIYFKNQRQETTKFTLDDLNKLKNLLDINADS